MTSSPIKLPYFDLILQRLANGDPATITAFGKHVHWGYWEDPSLAKQTPEDFRHAAEQLTHEVYSAALVGDGQTVFDIGCGFGGTIASLNEQFTGMDLTGLNIDPRQLAQARQNVTARPGNQITWVEGNACALPFADASCDRILAVECIFHFPDRRQFFQEAWRVLKPGGYLALSDFVPQAWFLPVTELNSTLSSDSGFYGQSNVQYSIETYRQLATELHFQPHIERDITENTLPTYDFLMKIGAKNGIDWSQWSAATQTLLIALVSRLHLVKYQILSYRKGN